MINIKTAFISALVAVLLAGGVAWACVPTITPVDCYEDQCITPTPTEEVTPTPEVTQPAPPSGVSDGRSDGRTESLGCQHPEDHCGVIVPKGAPNTGFDPNGTSAYDGKSVAWK